MYIAPYHTPAFMKKRAKSIHRAVQINWYAWWIDDKICWANHFLLLLARFSYFLCYFNHGYECTISRIVWTFNREKKSTLYGLPLFLFIFYFEGTSIQLFVTISIYILSIITWLTKKKKRIEKVIDKTGGDKMCLFISLYVDAILINSMISKSCVDCLCSTEGSSQSSTPCYSNYIITWLQSL